MERLIRSPNKEVMPSKRCLVVGSSDPSRDFRLSEVPTCVGTSGKPEEICSGVWGYPYVGSSDPSRDFRLSEVPMSVGTSEKPEEICSGVWGYPYVGSSDCRDFRPKSGLPTGLPTYLTENPVRICPFGFRSKLFQTRGKLRK